jgi:tryptophan synthase alpha subunit
VYLLARVGITGESAKGAAGGAVDAAALRERITLVRSMTNLPIACGFGIATPDHVRMVVKDAGADAAIVGSALVKRMARTSNERRDAVDEAEGFVRAMRAGLA